MTVRVFSSKFNVEPHEVHSFDGATVGDWLSANVKSYRRLEPQQFSIKVNGAPLNQHHWHSHEVSADDVIDITVEPKGTELFFGGLFLVATRMMTPKIPKVNSTSAGSGKELDKASIKGNKIKINDPRPEIAGFRKIYPSYLKPAVRRFNDRRDQRVSLCLDIGVGALQVLPSDIMIGDTPILNFGADAEWQIYQPGELVSGDPRAQWWHDVVEVGSGSNGSAGLEMTVAAPLTPGYNATVQEFVGYTVNIPDGAGSFPADWTAGIIVRIVAPYQYEVIEGGAGLRDIVRGMPLQMLAPTVGDEIEVSGPNAGLYIVNSYTPYAPAIPPSPGALSTLTASAPPTRYDYDVTPISFTVSLDGSDYPITLNTATTDLAGLVSAINTAKGAAPFSASGVGGRIILTQTGTPTGGSITSTAAVDVLGVAPTTVAGTAPTPGSPEQIPEMTLNFSDGVTPATTLTTGSSAAAIGPSGLRYRLVTASTTTLTVSRLDSSGDTDPSFPGFQYLSTASAVISLDTSNLFGGYRGPFALCPEGELTTEIEWDVFFPSGLIGNGRKGDQYAVYSNHVFEYRDITTAGAWTVIEKSVTGASMDSQGFTFSTTAPYPMRPEGRIRRQPKAGGANSAEVFDDVVWYGARTKLSGATSYPGNTVMTLTVRGGDRLSAQSESQVWLKATRILPVRRFGVWQPPEATRDIVPFCLYLLKSVGYTDADLDLAEWDRLDVFWRARGDTYDQVHAEEKTVQQVLEEALAAGFAEVTVKNGLLRPVRDEPTTIYKALYTADAMTEQLDIRFDAIRMDDYDGVDVEYMDGVKWQVATVKCRLGADLGRRTLKIKIEGITSKLKAYQIGMRRRRELKYRRKTFSWSTEMAAFNSNYGDLVQVGGETPGYAQSTIMEDYSGTVITATEPFQWDEMAPPYFVSVRRQDGSNFGPVQVTRVDDYRADLMTPLDFPPTFDMSMERPHILFGVGYGVQITDINPDGTESAGCQARIYDARVYLDDDSPLPA